MEMPKYIDYHAKAPQMSPELMKEAQKAMKSGKPDQFGVKAINGFMSKAGSSWCLTEAPNADAVCKSHESKGMKIGKGDVHEVQSMV